MTRRSLPFVAVLAAALLLSGCLGKLLGGGKPAQLYRLDAAVAAPPAAAPPPGITRTILLAPVRFGPAIEGDRMLANRGRESLYIAGARWVSPAPDLFEQALRRSFRARAPWLALVDRKDGVTADRALLVSIERFEVRYASEGAAPAIDIEGEAMMIDQKTHATIGRHTIAVNRPAGSNDVAAIVVAFDAASAAVIDGIVGWAAH